MRRSTNTKHSKEKNKKKNGIGKIILITVLILLTGLGFYAGYFIQKNGGGLQGILATVLAQDIEMLEQVDPINVLVLRNKWRPRFKAYWHNNGMFV